MTTQHWSIKFRAASSAAGAEGLHFHDLRHLAGTLAASTGASTKELMAQLGHSTPRASLIYQHATERRDREIAAGIDAILAAAREDTDGSEHRAEIVDLDRSRTTGPRDAESALRRGGFIAFYQQVYRRASDGNRTRVLSLGSTPEGSQEVPPSTKAQVSDLPNSAERPGTVRDEGFLRDDPAQAENAADGPEN